MPFLICEPTEEDCQAIEVTRDIPSALAAVHAHVVVADYHIEGEKVGLASSFIALRHIKAERDLPVTLPRGWATAYGAYVVRIGDPAVTLDTKMFILEF